MYYILHVCLSYERKVKADEEENLLDRVKVSVKFDISANFEPIYVVIGFPRH